MRNFKNPEGQLAHWLEKLEEFSFSVEHRAGNKHHHADALSRQPATDIAIATTKIATDFLHDKYPELNLVSLQQNDSVIGPVLQAKETKEGQLSTDMVKQYDYCCRRLFQLWDQLIVKDSLLYRQFLDVKKEHKSLAVGSTSNYTE